MSLKQKLGIGLATIGLAGTLGFTIKYCVTKEPIADMLYPASIVALYAGSTLILYDRLKRELNYLEKNKETKNDNI